MSATMRFGAQTVQQNVAWSELLDFWRFLEQETPLYSTRERLERFDEAAALLRAVMKAEKPVTFHGRYYRLENAPFLPGFVQKPHPPLMIGGGGEKRTLRTTARYADVANVVGPLSVVRHKLQVLEAHCEKEGRDYEAIEKTAHVPVVTHEDPTRLALIKAFVKDHFGLTERQLREEVPVGTASHVCEVVERYAELGVSAIIFPTPAPWDRETFRYLHESVIRVFEGDSP